MPLLQACLSFCLQIRFMPNYFAIKFKQHTLKKKRIKCDDCCGFCCIVKETISHVFVMCENYLAQWRNYSLHFYTATSNRVGINIMYVAKKFFFSFLFKQNFKLCILLCHLKVKYDIERCVVIHSSKLSIFESQ